MNHPKSLAPKQCHHTLSAGYPRPLWRLDVNPRHTGKQTGGNLKVLTSATFRKPLLRANVMKSGFFSRITTCMYHYNYIYVYIYIYIHVWIYMNINQSFNQAISRSIATAGNQAKRHFFFRCDPHAPRAQGLGTDQTFQWMVWPNFCDVQLCFATSLSIEQNQVLHAWKLRCLFKYVWKTIFWWDQRGKTFQIIFKESV